MGEFKVGERVRFIDGIEYTIRELGPTICIQDKDCFLTWARPDELERIPPPPPAFKVGDRVRYNGEPCVIAEDRRPSETFIIRDPRDIFVYGVHPSELTHLDPDPIAPYRKPSEVMSYTEAQARGLAAQGTQQQSGQALALLHQQQTTNYPMAAQQAQYQQVYGLGTMQHQQPRECHAPGLNVSKPLDADPIAERAAQVLGTGVEDPSRINTALVYDPERSRLADECGRLHSENTQLIAENARLRRELEQLQRRAPVRGKR